ncbi:hypothetical protein KL925_004296 [Ogataea polymorpha]|uniref:uncharacterized protein n=1 Tax=Ogataea polymorpha TaxID=460523 RepID=UPI0007F5571D|nr:uncharacterized protein OGAPODRAFT_99951 [Ogataea polymorpha]KAG7878395.1 hypothetical protein KL937_003637 [Ogataea polymorpha]KAG7890338.1 hypothetical protein KL908_004175 [Ogataea polymorpha]KAG7899094.1 hypothetical protein KL935_004102 [Ogataea polymorpha]KAG7907213.1 hypothetical protein KL906_003900 [Ogataea polymorpha]KAG7925281.1 hypothetical protein KL925_004296 [Ogataea polymorpha]
MSSLAFLAFLWYCSYVFALPTELLNLNLEYSSHRPENARNIRYEFNHGLASGDPTNTSIILWTRLTPEDGVREETTVFLQIADNVLFENSTEYCITTGPEIDYTVKVDVEGLQPGKSYFYRFYGPSGSSTMVATTKTLPASESLDTVNFAVYSCSNFANGFFTSYRMPALKNSVDYVIHLGDYIYEYGNGKYTNGTGLDREHHPLHECWTLDDYRVRHSQYKGDSDLQASHAKFPWIVVWDDHEVADNSWLRGSVNSDGFQFYKRRENAIRAYMEWMPIRPNASNPYKIWRKLEFGNLIDLMMLDTRHYSRDITDVYRNTQLIAGLADVEERTMMGFDQEDWLYESLKNSDKVWKLIGSQTVIAEVDFTPIGDIIGPPFAVKNYDTFDGYTANRRRLLEAISQNHVNNTVILAGDFHIAWINELFLNKSEYDMTTGKGSLAVELATSACSSPSTFPRNSTLEQCYDTSKKLLEGNSGLIWNEGYYRGYFELEVSSAKMEVTYFGVNISNSDPQEYKLASFEILRDSNHVHRDIARPSYGYLDKRVQK